MQQSLDHYLTQNCFTRLRDRVVDMLVGSVVLANFFSFGGENQTDTEELMRNRIHFDFLPPPEDGNTYQAFPETDAAGDPLNIVDGPTSVLPEAPDWIGDQQPFLILYPADEEAITFSQIYAPGDFGPPDLNLTFRLERAPLPGLSMVMDVDNFTAHAFGLIQEILDIAIDYNLTNMQTVTMQVPPFLVPTNARTGRDRVSCFIALTMGIETEGGV